ncbi:hypothetical protein LCGC14_1233380 [marine sediment metagenome]|uniref:signal peptidase I n=1 Tax=marine sediment metagenome TaxID=412755 RepID=A0A0F9PC60_9ZZZZ
MVKAIKSKLNLTHKIILSIVVVTGILAVLGQVYFIMTYKPYKAELSAMVPTISPDERFIVNKRISKSDLKRGDIITYREESNRVNFKRIIGMPNERIKFDEGSVVVNGKKLKEPYIKFKDFSSNEVTQIGGNEYYMLGDNRPNSRDSRYYGPISFDQINGKVILIYFPIKNIRLIKNPL